MSYLTLIVVAVVGFAIGTWLGKSGLLGSRGIVPKEPEEMKKLQEKARAAFGARTEERKGRILNFMNNDLVHDEELRQCGVSDIKDGVTSLNIEKLLDVSDGTARKYLNELESENKVKQIGKSGPNVHYVLRDV